MPLLINKTSKVLLRLEENPLLALAALLCASLLIKIFLIAQADIINTDGIRYVNSAHQLFQGDVSAAFSHEKMLGFTLLLGLTHILIPDWFLAGKILSCVALLLTTIPLYLIAKELFGLRAAFFTALAFTIAPSINEKCTAVIKDPPFLFLVVLSLWLVIYALKKSRWNFCLPAGLLACLALLFRPEGIVFFFAMTLSMTLFIVFVTASRRLHLKCLVAFWTIPVAGLTAAMVLLATGVMSWDILPTIYDRFAYYFQVNPLSVYLGIYQHLKDVEGNFPGGQWTNDFFEYARYNMPLIYLLGILQTFGKALFPVFVVPFVVGLKLRNRLQPPTLLLLIVWLCFFLMDYLYLVSHNFLSARYLLVLVVLSFVLVGYGLDRIIDFFADFRYRHLALSMTVVLCVLLPLGKILVNDEEEKIELRQAGLWLRQRGDMAANRMIVSEERIAFYAGLLRGDYVTFPDGDPRQLEQKALQNNCRLLVVYKNLEELETKPHFENYGPIEEFRGPKNVAIVYERKS